MKLEYVFSRYHSLEFSCLFVILSRKIKIACFQPLKEKKTIMNPFFL